MLMCGRRSDRRRRDWRWLKPGRWRHDHARRGGIFGLPIANPGHRLTLAGGASRHQQENDHASCGSELSNHDYSKRPPLPNCLSCRISATICSKSSSAGISQAPLYGKGLTRFGQIFFPSRQIRTIRPVSSLFASKLVPGGNKPGRVSLPFLSAINVIMGLSPIWAFGQGVLLQLWRLVPSGA